MDADDTNSLLKAYAISTALLYVHYFYSQMTSLDPKSHLAEDNTLVAKDIDKLDQIEAGGDDAAKDQVNKMLFFFSSFAGHPSGPHEDVCCRLTSLISVFPARLLAASASGSTTKRTFLLTSL